MRLLQAARALAAGALASFVTDVREIASNVPPALRIPVLIGLLVLAGQLAGMPGTAWAAHGDWLYNGLEFAAPVFCAVRAVRQPRERAVWVLVALGTTSYAVGNVYWGLVLENDASPPYPSPADGFWLGLYPCLFAAMWLLARTRLREVNRRIWLDGLIVGLGLAALSASVVFRAVANGTDGDTMTIVTNLSYPAADLLALILIAVLFSAARTLADRTFQTLAAGIGVFLVTDSIYLVQIADGSYALNGMLDLGWPLAVVLIGVAAWQPAGSRGHARGDSSITLPTVLVRVCVVLMVYDHFVRVETLGVGLAAATLAAAVCRLVLTYRASSELMRITHKAALTDELTQLGNRAKLLRDLDVALNSDTRTLPVSSTSTASRPTRTPSVIPPATRCCTAWPAGWRWRCPRGARLPLGRRRVLHAHAMAGGHRRHERRAPSCDALSEQGEGFTITTSWGHAFVPAEASTTSNALSIADQRLYEDKAHGRVSARRESQQVLKRVLEQRDHMLGIHIDGVARLAEQTAAELGLDEADIERTVLAAELHDIGKSAIPDAILFKRGALNADEWAFMRRHTVIGERILAGAPSLTVVARIVRSTHERVDGKGYPDGLAGDEIPLAARIVFVCDAFDAMTSDRAYSAAITAELARGAARLRRLAVRPGRRRSIRARTRAIARARSLSATALSCAGHGSSPPPRILKP